jgi:hypothetical protein
MGVAVVACTPESESDPNEACGDTIITRINPDTDFSRIMTFAVVDEDQYPTDLPADLPSDTHEIMRAANGAARTSLLAQGLVEVDPDYEEPDVWLFSLASSETQIGYVWDCVPGYVWWGWSAWDYQCPWWEEVPVEYEVGTVVVGLARLTDDGSDDFMNTTGEVVFGGAVQGVLHCDDPRKRLTTGITKIFAQYPVPI